MAGGRGPAVGVATRAPSRGRPGVSRSYCPARWGQVWLRRCRVSAAGVREGREVRARPPGSALGTGRVLGWLPRPPPRARGCAVPPPLLRPRHCSPAAPGLRAPLPLNARLHPRCPQPQCRPPRCPSSDRAPLPVVHLRPGRPPLGGTVPPARRRGMPGRCGRS